MIKAYVEVGDHVRCNNCDTEMLVPHGADICPNCGYNGALAWVSEDEDKKEASDDEFEDVESCELPYGYVANGKSEFDVEICAHRIHCQYDDELPCEELPESEEEHIQQCLIEGYHQGELCYIDRYNNTHLGYWNIE